MSDRGKKATMFNLSVYLLLLTTLEVSVLFLSLGRYCLCQFFVAVSWSKTSWNSISSHSCLYIHFSFHRSF